MREVGIRMGISHSWVEKVEAGERRLDVEEFVRLCEVIHVEPERGIAIIKAAITPYTASSSLKAVSQPASDQIPRKPKHTRDNGRKGQP